MADKDKAIRIDFHNITEDMKLKAVEFAQQWSNANKGKQFDNKHLATELKKAFDEIFHPTWQCIVGKSFGTDIGYEENHVIYFYLGPVAILLWKAG